jgi:anti-sigma factor RsiW
MLTCRELTELVDAYVDGRMGFGDRARFQIHLAICPGCRAYVEQLRATRGALTQLPDPPLEDGVRDELLRIFRDWKQDKA